MMLEINKMFIRDGGLKEDCSVCGFEIVTSPKPPLHLPSPHYPVSSRMILFPYPLHTIPFISLSLVTPFSLKRTS